MTLEPLERRVLDLAREVAELRTGVRPLRPYADISQTFGLLANDPVFDEIVRLGREYRDRANATDNE